MTMPNLADAEAAITARDHGGPWSTEVLDATPRAGATFQAAACADRYRNHAVPSARRRADQPGRVPASPPSVDSSTCPSPVEPSPVPGGESSCCEAATKNEPRLAPKVVTVGDDC